MNCPQPPSRHGLAIVTSLKKCQLRRGLGATIKSGQNVMVTSTSTCASLTPATHSCSPMAQVTAGVSSTRRWKENKRIHLICKSVWSGGNPVLGRYCVDMGGKTARDLGLWSQTLWVWTPSLDDNCVISILRASQMVLVVKNTSANAGDAGYADLLPGWERSPGGGNGSPLQYSGLENSMDRGAWEATRSMWSQRVRHNWATDHSHTHTLLENLMGSCSSVQSLSRVRLFVTPWIAAHQASLSITNSRSLLKLMPIESVMPSSHLIFCHPLLLLPPIPPSIRAFSNESAFHMRWPKYWRAKN